MLFKRNKKITGADDIRYIFNKDKEGNKDFKEMRKVLCTYNELTKPSKIPEDNYDIFGKEITLEESHTFIKNDIIFYFGSSRDTLSLNTLEIYLVNEDGSLFRVFNFVYSLSRSKGWHKRGVWWGAIKNTLLEIKEDLANNANTNANKEKRAIEYCSERYGGQ